MFEGLKKFVVGLIFADRLVAVFGVSSLLSLLFGVWAHLSKMRPIEIALVMLVALAATVTLINGIRVFLNLRQEKMISERNRLWALSDHFAIFDAAHILARSDDEKTVRPYFRMLKERVDDGRINLGFTLNLPSDMWTKIPKSELIRLGREIGREQLFE